MGKAVLVLLCVSTIILSALFAWIGAAEGAGWVSLAIFVPLGVLSAWGLRRLLAEDSAPTPEEFSGEVGWSRTAQDAGGPELDSAAMPEQEAADGLR